jgi:AcrR family transcriptional regulator
MSTSTEPLSKKERTRRRIVETAARVLRRAGFDGVGVAEVMQEAGLTHGGFYAHFPSREALLAEALDHGAAQSLARLESEGAAQGLGELIDRYLSDEHAEHTELGCTLAALGSETPRQSAEVQSVATRRLKQWLARIEQQLPGSSSERREAALATMATLVGALVLSRLVNDKKLGRAFRNAAKAWLKGRSRSSASSG